jgi:hypothetical protein
MERSRIWLGPLALLLAGCSDGDETVLRSPPESPAGDGPVLVIGECVGQNTNCESTPKVETYQPGPTVTCETTHLGAGRILWSFSGAWPEGSPCFPQNGRAGPDQSVYFAIGRAVRP